MREPLRAIVLHEGFGERGTSYLGAQVDAGGALVVAGQEVAPLCAAMGEDLTKEVWLSLAPAWKDELVLRLLAERCRTSRELVGYLDSMGIEIAVRMA